MWSYGIALGIELVLMWLLLRQYSHRRTARTKSDQVRLAKEYYKTEKFKIELEEIHQRRNLLHDLEDILK